MKHFGFISVAAWGLLCILTLAGCRQGAHYRADLLRADSVMDAQLHPRRQGAGGRIG